MSPLFKKEKGYSFRVFSNEEERMHIHVFRDGCEAKYWLEPQIELATNEGFPAHELNKIKELVEEYGNDFKEKYRQHIGKRVDD